MVLLFGKFTGPAHDEMRLRRHLSQTWSASSCDKSAVFLLDVIRVLVIRVLVIRVLVIRVLVIRVLVIRVLVIRVLVIRVLVIRVLVIRVLVIRVLVIRVLVIRVLVIRVLVIRVLDQLINVIWPPDDMLLKEQYQLLWSSWILRPSNFLLIYEPAGDLRRQNRKVADTKDEHQRGKLHLPGVYTTLSVLCSAF